MTRKITRIVIQYSDGQGIEINQYELEALETLKDMINQLQTAKYVYDSLDRLFGEVKVK